MNPPSLTVFYQQQIVSRGDLAAVIRHLLTADYPAGQVLIFNDRTGKQIEPDLRGDEKLSLSHTLAAWPELAEAGDAVSDDEPAEQPPVRKGRGRPKLGVTAKEITLLPRHWDWLAEQPGGASAVIRRLIDEARKRTAGQDDIRRNRERAYQFLNAIAGNLPDYEAALRALFAGDTTTFSTLMQSWPEDIRRYATALAAIKDDENDMQTIS